MKILRYTTVFVLAMALAACATHENKHTSMQNTESENDYGFPIDASANSGKSFTFDWPVNEARLTRGFMPNKKRRPHLGIDLAAPKGTKIYASHDGLVIYAGRDFKGFGKMILLESGQGWATIYGHLDKITIKEGQVIKQGQVIGLMGRTGRSTGVHLHFEIRRNKGPVDPLTLLPNGDEAASKLAKK